MNYWRVRIFDYRKDDELKFYTENDTWEKYKETLLDEYYLCGETMNRDEVKKNVSEKSSIDKFAKPRKADGIYSLIMESNQFFYDRFNIDVDTICFHCHKPIKGKLKDFPYFEHNDVKYPCCSWDCKREVNQVMRGDEGEWQERENYKSNGGVFGYIYHIYNRSTNMHYIGQTIYMPFFRWQEHVKSGLKGDITDLSFEVVTEVRIQSQEYLNNIEAWWIRKFIEDYGRRNVANITVPKITIEYLVSEFSKLVSGQMVIEREVL